MEIPEIVQIPADAPYPTLATVLPHSFPLLLHRLLSSFVLISLLPPFVDEHRLETGIIWEYDSVTDEWCRGVVTFRMMKVNHKWIK